MDILNLGFGIITITLEKNDNALLCSRSVIKDMEYKLVAGDETTLEIYRYRKEIDKRFTYGIFKRGGDFHKYVTDRGDLKTPTITKQYRFQHIPDINYTDNDCLFLIQFNTETYSDHKLRLRFRNRQGHIQCRPFPLVTRLKKIQAKSSLGDRLNKSRKKIQKLLEKVKQNERVILDNKTATYVLQKQKDDLVEKFQKSLTDIEVLKKTLTSQNDGEKEQIQQKLKAEMALQQYIKECIQIFHTRITKLREEMGVLKEQLVAVNQQSMSDRLKLQESLSELDAVNRQLKLNQRELACSMKTESENANTRFTKLQKEMQSQQYLYTTLDEGRKNEKCRIERYVSKILAENEQLKSQNKILNIDIKKKQNHIEQLEFDLLLHNSNPQGHVGSLSPLSEPPDDGRLFDL